MIPTTEIEALQNFANRLKLEIQIHYKDDKRIKTTKYFALCNGYVSSPPLDYENMNHFLLGWNNALKTLNK